MNNEAKTAWQTLLLAQKSDACCFHGHKPLKHKEFKDQKDSEAKKNHFFAINGNSASSGKFGQTLCQSSQKDTCL